jgi:hypothetical protein
MGRLCHIVIDMFYMPIKNRHHVLVSTGFPAYMATVRYTTSNLETERFEQFADQWRTIYDKKDSYESERSKLLSAVSSLEGEIVNEDPDKIKSRFHDLESIASEIQSESLEPLVDNIRDLDIRSEDYITRRDNVKCRLESLYSDLETIEDRFDDEDISTEPRSLNDRFFSAISTSAEEDAKNLLDLDETKEFVKNAKNELSSNSMKTSYRGEVVDSLENHLLMDEELEDEELQKNIRHLFVELIDNGWPREGLDKVLDRFVRNEHDSQEDRVDEFCETVRDIHPETTVIIPFPDFPEELAGIDMGDLLIKGRNAEEIRFDERFETRQGETTESVFKLDIGTVAKTTVTGDIDIVARQRANERLETVLDVLNVGVKYSLDSPVGRSTTREYVETDEGVIRPLHASKELSYMNFTSREEVDDKLEHFEGVFQPENSTELKRTMKNALRWHRYGVESDQTSEKFLKFVISLECVLVPRRNEKKASNIVERGTDSLRVLSRHRNDVMDFFGSVYELRNQITHSAEYSLSEIELNLDLLRKRSGSILGTVASYLDSCDDIDEFFEALEDQNQEIREEKIKNSPVDLGESFSVDAELQQRGGSTKGIATLDVKFKEGGEFVYYQGEVVGFESGGESEFVMNAAYDLAFELDGTRYRAESIIFLNGFVSDVASASEDDPAPVRFFDIESSSDGDE